MFCQQIFPGSYYLSDGSNGLLAGCPPEIVKVLIQRGLKPPQNILLPDVPVSMGESQVAVEFPLYFHLFSATGKGLPEPLNLIGNARRVSAAAELLELTLFGPDARQMRKWDFPTKSAAAFAREISWFHIKDKQGKTAPLAALVAKTVLADQPVDLGWLKIQRVKSNVFRAVSEAQETFDLNLHVDCEQRPPYPVSGDLVASKLAKMSVLVLGGSTGFSATQASSGLALCFNGHFLLIDAIPYLNQHLLARGIARNQVQSLFLSHIHDDHCNLISLLQYNRRMQVLTTPLIYHMMLQKLALQLDRPVESLRGYFTFVPLAPDQETNFFGLRITPFYSSHSIPTIGARFETVHEGMEYRILFTADTQALADLKRMQRTGVISPERYQAIAKLYRMPAHLLIADGGEGAIHGDPADALNSPAERVVFLHTDKLPDRFASHFTAATVGKQFCVLRGETDFSLTRAIEFLLEYFPGMPPMWISHLLANQRVMEFNAGDVIIRQGAKSEGHVYILLCGYAAVALREQSRTTFVAIMEAGEIIGEMSILSGQGIRNASVVALSPVLLTALSEVAFHEYVRHQHLQPALQRMWQNRELLQTLPYLETLQQPVIRALSLHVSLESLPARSAPVSLARICGLASLLIPLDQEIILRRAGTQLVAPINSAPILCQNNDWLITKAKFQYLLLRAEQAAELCARIPAFRFFWEESLRLPIPECRS